MIGIGRRYIVRDVFLKKDEIDGIAVPDISQEAPGYIQILNLGLKHDDSDLEIGDVAITTSNKANVSIIISNLPRVISVDEDLIVAAVEDEVEIPENVRTAICESEISHHKNLLPKHKKLRALQDKVVIFPDKKKDFRKYGEILIPNFKDHETLRSHTGIVAAVTKKTAEISGLEVGMRVFYDYYSPFSHDTDYHITKLENLIGVLNIKEEKLLELEQ